MQNFLMLAPSIAQTDGFASSTGDGRIGMVDTRDVAAVAAEIVISPTTHQAKTYWPTGPERLSYSRAAEGLSPAFDRTINVHPLTDEEQRQAVIDAGLSRSRRAGERPGARPLRRRRLRLDDR